MTKLGCPVPQTTLSSRAQQNDSPSESSCEVEGPAVSPVGQFPGFLPPSDQNRATILIIPMEFKTVINKFLYRIEAKPGGGFIATCKDSSLPPIEGATRTEVEQKIQESISAGLAAQFPSLKPLFENKEVKLSYHIDPKPGGGYIVHHGDPNSNDPAHQPIEGSTREHVESLIESKLFSALMERLPPEMHQQIADKLNSGGLDVTVNRRVSFTTKIGGQSDLSAEKPLALDLNPGPATEVLPPGADTINQSPITYEKHKSGGIFRFLLALMALAALMYFYLHRR